MLRKLIALSLAFALAACGIFETRAQRATRNTPSYKEGYDDGCATANASGANYRGSQVRDDALYESDHAYRAGWANGLSICRASLAPQEGTRVSPVPDNEPGR